MYLAIISVKPIENYRLLLTFSNNEKRIFDLTSYIDKGIFKELRDQNKFDKVKISFDAIEWENGADLDPELLYAESSPTDDAHIP